METLFLLIILLCMAGAGGAIYAWFKYPEKSREVWRKINQAPVFRLGVIGILTFIMLLPQTIVDGIADEDAGAVGGM